MRRTRREVVAATAGITLLAGCQFPTDSDAGDDSTENVTETDDDLPLDELPPEITETGIDRETRAWVDGRPFTDLPTHHWAAYEHESEIALLDDDGQPLQRASRESVVASNPLRGFLFEETEVDVERFHPEPNDVNAVSQLVHFPYDDVFVTASRRYVWQAEDAFRDDDSRYYATPEQALLFVPDDDREGYFHSDTAEVEPAVTRSRDGYYTDLEPAVRRLLSLWPWFEIAVTEPVWTPVEETAGLRRGDTAVTFEFESIDVVTIDADDPVTVPASGDVTVNRDGTVPELHLRVETDYVEELGAAVDVAADVGLEWNADAAEEVEAYEPSALDGYDILVDERELHCEVSNDLVAITNRDSEPLHGPLSISVYVDGGVAHHLLRGYQPNREERFDDVRPPTVLAPGETMYVTRHPDVLTDEFHHFVDDRPDDRGTYFVGGSHLDAPPRFESEHSFVLVKRQRIDRLLEDVSRAEDSDAMEAYYDEHSHLWGPRETHGYDVLHVVDPSPERNSDL